MLVTTGHAVSYFRTGGRISGHGRFLGTADVANRAGGAAAGQKRTCSWVTSNRLDRQRTCHVNIYGTLVTLPREMC